MRWHPGLTWVGGQPVLQPLAPHLQQLPMPSAQAAPIVSMPPSKTYLPWVLAFLGGGGLLLYALMRK